jgi:hypothetical protein
LSEREANAASRDENVLCFSKMNLNGEITIFRIACFRHIAAIIHHH